MYHSTSYCSYSDKDTRPKVWAKQKVAQNSLPINIPLFVANTQVHLIDMVVGSPGAMISVSGEEDRGYPDVDEGPGVDTVQDFLYKLGMKPHMLPKSIRF